MCTQIKINIMKNARNLIVYAQYYNQQIQYISCTFCVGFWTNNCHSVNAIKTHLAVLQVPGKIQSRTTQISNSGYS